MEFWELWEEVDRKNPQIRTGKVAMSSENFKKALRYAYNKGSVNAADTSGSFFDEFLKGMKR